MAIYNYRGWRHTPSIEPQEPGTYTFQIVKGSKVLEQFKVEAPSLRAAQRKAQTRSEEIGGSYEYFESFQKM